MSGYKHLSESETESGDNYSKRDGSRSPESESETPKGAYGFSPATIGSPEHQKPGLMDKFREKISPGRPNYQPLSPRKSPRKSPHKSSRKSPGKSRHESSRKSHESPRNSPGKSRHESSRKSHESPRNSPGKSRHGSPRKSPHESPRKTPKRSLPQTIARKLTISGEKSGDDKKNLISSESEDSITATKLRPDRPNKSTDVMKTEDLAFKNVVQVVGWREGQDPQNCHFNKQWEESTTPSMDESCSSDLISDTEEGRPAKNPRKEEKKENPIQDNPSAK